VADADRLSACKLKCLAANSTAKSGLRTGSRRGKEASQQWVENGEKDSKPGAAKLRFLMSANNRVADKESSFHFLYEHIALCCE